ncbi:MAG: sigma-70 family RNA polymerase sigma factor [Clostridiales bacterium]|nr:sigma-70 family RNA polymerase sigma factor [Clostridiales bacterium]
MGHQKIEPSKNEELVLLANTGDNGAMEQLLSSFLPLIKIKAAAFRAKGMDEDDLVQEGLLGLLNAVYTFNPKANTSFATYASVCIQNRMTSAARSHFAKKNIPINFGVPFDDFIHAGSSNYDPQELLAAKEESARLLEIINFKLSGFEKSVLKCYLAGKTYKQTAKALATTAKAVDNALQRIKRKLKSTDI